MSIGTLDGSDCFRISDCRSDTKRVGQESDTTDRKEKNASHSIEARDYKGLAWEGLSRLSRRASGDQGGGSIAAQQGMHGKEESNAYMD